MGMARRAVLSIPAWSFLSIAGLSPASSQPLLGLQVPSPRPALPDDDLPAPSKTVLVSNDDELDAAIAEAQPGHQISILPGTYQSSRRKLSIEGRADAPIVLLSATIGEANIRNGFEFLAKSKNVILHGLRFDDGGPGRGAVIYIRGQNHKIRRCYFKTSFNEGNSRSTIRLSHCNNIEISYSSFTQYQREWTESDRNTANNHIQGFHRDAKGRDVARNVQIKCCHFYDMPPQINYRTPYLKVLSNTLSPVQARVPTDWLLQYCLFENINSGFVIWEFKGANASAEYNTMLNSDGYVSFRDGDNCVGIGNWMENCQSWRIHRSNCGLFYNKFINAEIEIMAGQISQDTYGSEDWSNAFNTVLVGNEGPVMVGRKFVDESFPASNTRIYGHTGKISYGMQNETVVEAAISEDFKRVTPVRLTRTDVGPLAGI